MGRLQLVLDLGITKWTIKRVDNNKIEIELVVKRDIQQGGQVTVTFPLLTMAGVHELDELVRALELV